MDATRPLRGMRVIELGAFWAGPYATALLADLGAEVVKIETLDSPDLRMPPREHDGRLVLDKLPFYDVVNRGKRGCTLNVADPRGLELLLRLLADADALVENFSAGARRKLGLEHGRLAAVNPRLVHVSLSGFGSDGPFSGFRAYGPTLEALSGLNTMLGYEGGAPGNVGVGITDPLGGVYGAFVTLAGLLDARRTGQGAHIDFSQLEGVLSVLPQPVLDFELNGVVPAPAGAAAEPGVPSGAYPCAGEDQWVALTVETPAEWAALAGVLGLPREQWTTLAEPAARRAARAELDALVSAWSRERAPREAAEALQAAGIPAAPVSRVPEVLADPHLTARGSFTEAGGVAMYAPAFAFATADGAFARPPVDRPGPEWGQDNDDVFTRLLGLDAADIERLAHEGVLR